MVNGIGNNYVISTGYAFASKVQMSFNQKVGESLRDTANTDSCFISGEAMQLYKELSLYKKLTLERVFENTEFSDELTVVGSLVDEEVKGEYKGNNKLLKLFESELFNKWVDNPVDFDYEKDLEELIELLDEVLKYLETLMEKEEEEEADELELNVYVLENSTHTAGKSATRAAWYDALKKADVNAGSIIGKIKAAMTGTPSNNNEFVSKWNKLLDAVEEKETKEKDEEARLAFIDALANIKPGDLQDF